MQHHILMIENDSDDRYITEETFRLEGLDARVDFIYSRELHVYIKEAVSIPHLVLLDTNTHPHAFTDLIKRIRQTEGYQLVPIVVVSTTGRPEDIQQSYACGASSFILKPDSYAATVFKIKTFINYWFQSVELPVV